MQEVVSAIGEQVEVADDLLVLLLAELRVRLGVAHLQDLGEEEVCEVVFREKERGVDLSFSERTFSRTRKARTPVRVATPILNKPPSSPESMTCTDVNFICCQKRGSNQENSFPYMLICFWEKVKKNIAK